MKRFRALAAFLTCLAVLASGVATVSAAAPVGTPTTDRSLAGVPCSHCPDCDGVPCPMPAADCLQASTSAAPVLTATASDLPQVGSIVVRWAPRVAILSGLSPPPDPFPPRV